MTIVTQIKMRQKNNIQEYILISLVINTTLAPAPTLALTTTSRPWFVLIRIHNILRKAGVSLQDKRGHKDEAATEDDITIVGDVKRPSNSTPKTQVKFNQ